MWRTVFWLRDWSSVIEKKNISSKAKGNNRASVWILFCLIVRKGADPVIGGTIFVVVVISVLLYRSETWVWNLSMLNSIRGFCHLASRRLANKRPKQLKNGTYKYCKEVEASIEGLKTAATNLSVNCLEMAARSYLHREAAYYIHELCQTTKRIAGTPTGTVFWREQDLLH